MNIKNIFKKTSFVLNKYSPEIFLGVGIVGTIVGTVLACSATIKAKDAVVEFKDKVEELHENENKPDVSEKEYRKELTHQYVKLGLNLLKLYAPAIIIETGSIVSIFGSNKILKERTAEALAAYATISRAFKAYRERIKERFGEEVEKDILYGVERKTIETEVIDENGNRSKIKEEVAVIDKNIKDHSPFAVIFDKTNVNWCNDYNARIYFLESVQAFCTEKLQAQGYLFLNDVYKELGFPLTKAGQIFGWRWFNRDDRRFDKLREKWNGDGRVDFMMYDPNDQLKVNFIDGYEPAIILDFNVDGDILNYTGETKNAKEILCEFMR